MKKYNRFWSILFLVLVMAILQAPASAYGDEYYRARILAMEEERIDEYRFQQTIDIRFLQGPYRGEEHTIYNYYHPSHPMSIAVDKGMEVIVIALTESDGIEFYIQDIARDRPLYYLLGATMLLMILVGGFKGIKTIISLCVTGLLIFFFLLPRLLEGANPIGVSLLVTGLSMIITLLLVSGYNKKTLTALLGTSVGLLLAGLLTYAAGHLIHLTGFSSDEAQSLYYLDSSLDIRGILFAGILIGSMGAITDVGISVASAAAEIRESSPRIKTGQLMAGAMNVGRDVLGTMANTLILAYVGAATPLLLLVMGHELEWLRFINMDLIASEIFRALVGVVGLTASVPATALLAGLLLKQKQGKARTPVRRKK